MKPLVSILIPAYNARNWIAETIESALAQTWPNKEVIVVDDGSRDDTAEIARRFSSRRVQVIVQENQGASTARNTAFAHAQGDYIQWLDADDLLSPKKVETQMVVVEQGVSPRTLLSGGWAEFLSRPHRAVFRPTPLWADLSPLEWLIRKMGLNLHMQTATWLVSRELTEAAGPWDPRLTTDDDGEYFCRVLLASDGVRFVENCRTYYRTSGSSSLSYLGRSRKKLESQLLSMRLHIGYLRSLEQSSRVDQACLAYLRTWYPYFYPDQPDLMAELQALAREAGGSLSEPELSWKYDWIRKLFGWRAAQRAKVFLPQMKWGALIRLDRVAARLEGRRAPL
jgi:glycosyltransferase involved in cell wall biosynthesis